MDPKEVTPRRPGFQRVPFTRPLSPERMRLLGRLMRTCSFFSGMVETEVAEFLRLCKRKTYPMGMKIFAKGEPGDCMYVIVSGEVLIAPGESREIRLGSCQIFGEMCLLEGNTRSATAWALKKTALLVVGRGALASWMPGLRAKALSNIAKQLAANLRRADTEVEHYQKLLHEVPRKGMRVAGRPGEAAG